MPLLEEVVRRLEMGGTARDNGDNGDNGGNSENSESVRTFPLLRIAVHRLHPAEFGEFLPEFEPFFFSRHDTPHIFIRRRHTGIFAVRYTLRRLASQLTFFFRSPRRLRHPFMLGP